MKAGFICVFFLLAVPVATDGHVYFLECSPAENSVVTEPPDKVFVRFAGSVEAAFSRLEVYDSSGTLVSGKNRFLDRDMVMEADIVKPLTPGTYTVQWKCMSMDGHTQKGSYTFTLQ